VKSIATLFSPKQSAQAKDAGAVAIDFVFHHGK
jgi:hypothetical protein